MRVRRRAIAPLVAALFAAGAAAGCGGSGSGSTQTATAVVPAASTPERYVDSVCTAAATMYSTYRKNFNDNLASLGGMDPTDAYTKVARQPFAILVSELEKMFPPPEAAAAHDESVRQAKDVLDALNRGDRQKLLALRGTPDTGKWKQVIDLSPDLKSRFGQMSAQVKSCQDLEQNGGGNPFE